MSQIELKRQRRRWLSLSVRVSMGLVLATILPLFITIVFSEAQTRPALITQANTAMESDARTRVQLIDTYFNERLLDAETLTQVPSLQSFLALPSPPRTPIPTYQDAQVHAGYSLAAGIFRDKNYITWTLFNPQGKLLLYYPTSNAPKPHGQYLVPPEYLQEVATGKAFISAVYYSPEMKRASVDIYAPVITLDTHAYLGFMRATLGLDYIWNIVKGDLANNGTGSYAFILDENGIRIADTHAQRLFKSVAPLSADIQQQISKEQRFGTADTVPVLADNMLASTHHTTNRSITFQSQPGGESEQFQVTQYTCTSVPWKYLVLSPLNTVTAVANQQLLTTGLIALTVSLLIAIIGLITGRGITRPILKSVEHLLNNSQALSTLATSQQDAASEQMWVVDSSQVGLQSIQYYTDAIKVVASQLSKIGTELAQHWDHNDAYTIQQALERIVKAAQYIEDAARYQSISNQKLSTALKVATQVTEQLVVGTTSATDAAIQLEQVVDQLRDVVGK